VTSREAPPLDEPCETSKKNADKTLPLPKVRIETVGGVLEIYADQLSGEVRFNDQVLFHGDAQSTGIPWRSLSRYFGPVAPFEQVYLLRWDGQGNGCEGYGFTFLGINADGTFEQADIRYCGGSEDVLPVVISASPTEVSINIPRRPFPHRDGFSAAETWVYRNRVVKRTR